MVKVKEDLTNRKFGRWTVIKQSENYITPKGRHSANWLCRCECGTIRAVHGWMLKSGKTISCGCYNREVNASRGKKYNTFDLSGKYGIGYTSKNEMFYFDKEDYDKIKNYCWYINHHGYLMARRINENRVVLFHRLVFNEPNQIIDHKNHNKLDNRKENLRLCTAQQNNMNRSHVKGITYHKRDKKWQATIGYNYQHIHLGYFDTEEEAIKARKQAENLYFGQYSFDSSNKED